MVRLPRFGFKTLEVLQNVADKIPVDRIDIIHHQLEYGLMQNLESGFYTALKGRGKPIVTTCHSVGNFQIDGVIANNSDRVIVHNKFCARHFGYPCVIIPHGTKPFKCPPLEKAKKRLGIDPKIPIIGYCGFISQVKGLETLIEAIMNVPKSALLIVGGSHVGAETEYMLKLKEETLKVLQGRCQWTGWVPDERLPIMYGAMDVVVYPSRFITESGALLMALSHGKAVIASRLPPVREKEKLGALTTFKDAKDLRRKIKRLLKDEKLRRKLEEGARNYTISHSWDKIARLHQSLYENVIRSEGGESDA